MEIIWNKMSKKWVVYFGKKWLGSFKTKEHAVEVGEDYEHNFLLKQARELGYVK